MTALEEIKKALEGVTPGPWSVHERSSYFGIFSQSVARGLVKEGRLVATFAKPHDYARTNARYIAAVNPTAISELLSTLESLQRDNEELRQRLDVGPCGEDAIDVAESAADHLRHRAEAAEAEVKLIRDAVGELLDQAEHVCLGAHTPLDIKEAARNLADSIAKVHTALASTGGEHHAE